LDGGGGVQRVGCGHVCLTGSPRPPLADSR
jgi:hypothetical protein